MLFLPLYRQRGVIDWSVVLIDSVAGLFDDDVAMKQSEGTKGPSELFSSLDFLSAWLFIAGDDGEWISGGRVA
jgi:hypothetical protein